MILYAFIFDSWDPSLWQSKLEVFTDHMKPAPTCLSDTPRLVQGQFNTNVWHHRKHQCSSDPNSISDKFLQNDPYEIFMSFELTSLVSEGRKGELGRTAITVQALKRFLGRSNLQSQLVDFISKLRPNPVSWPAGRLQKAASGKLSSRWRMTDRSKEASLSLSYRLTKLKTKY
ncbi:hypothetical protein CEXT_624681 [Caerostris extrusa]|uniref:Uncharacterized protein n=1 Tax=Caerostris extrusa TaxID=172846 RepID=A0AAV4TZI0_CAEEX|nr:hypothetical protein CEXT_624681 [Caerostris extrusa]